MRDLDRRAFVGAALAAFPLAVLGRTGKVSADTAGLISPGRSDAGADAGALDAAKRVEAASPDPSRPGRNASSLGQGIRYSVLERCRMCGRLSATRPANC